MATHDGYGRRTPFEVFAPDSGFADERFPAIESEAQSNGIDLWNPAAFLMLGAVSTIVADLRPEDPSDEMGPGAGLPEHGVLLYHAFHLWHEKGAFWLVPAAVLRDLLRSDLSFHPVPPGEARVGYAQFARHLVWLEGDLESPETIDGFFWVVTPGDEVHVLFIAGMVEGRPGFMVVPIPGLALAEFNRWAGAATREDGPDFASALPGRELDDLLGVVSAAEGAKLAARVVGAVLSVGADPTPTARPDSGGKQEGPTPSRYPFQTLLNPKGKPNAP